MQSCEEHSLGQVLRLIKVLDLVLQADTNYLVFSVYKINKFGQQYNDTKRRAPLIMFSAHFTPETKRDAAHNDALQALTGIPQTLDPVVNIMLSAL